MRINIKNCSQTDFLIKINNSVSFQLFPNEVRTVEISNKTKLSLCYNYTSTYNKVKIGWTKRKIANIVLDTHYILKDIDNIGEIRVHTVREAVAKPLNLYYEYFVIDNIDVGCSMNCFYTVCGKEEFEYVYKKAYRKEVIDRVISSSIAGIITSISLGAILKYNISIIILIMLFFVLGIIIELLIIFSERKKIKIIDGINDTFISSFFSSVNRPTYMTWKDGKPFPQKY